MGRAIIHNPVLTGFHPDPCICKAQGKYYMITSTFEWFPGVSLYESDDLVTWTPKGGILDKIDLRGIPDSGGIWAPALSYDNGTFYLVYTISRQIDGYFKDVKNYVVTAPSIEGPWSRPMFINASGFDPSMFHEDGRHYVLNPQWDPRPLPGHKKFNGLILQEFHMEKGLVGPWKLVFQGSGTNVTEGPHLMKKDGYYYIIAAEGGTGVLHSICVARSRNLWGPYEISPYHPLITSWEQDTPLKKSGHGNFVETDRGEWYMTHLCSRYLDNVQASVLGREAAMQKLEWINGWPRMVQKTCVPALWVDGPKGTGDQTDSGGQKEAAESAGHGRRDEGKVGYWTDFSRGTDLAREEWLSLRYCFQEKGELTEQGLWLKGGDSLTSCFDQSLIARRWTSFQFQAGTSLRFAPNHYNQTAGLVCYYNTKVFHYLYVGYDERKNRSMVNILTNDNFQFHEPLEGNYVYLPEDAGEIHLRVEVDQEELRFYYGVDQGDFQGIGPVLDASILCDEHPLGWAYTGAVVGITAVDNFNKDTKALFTEFYQTDSPGLEKP